MHGELASSDHLSPARRLGSTQDFGGFGSPQPFPWTPQWVRGACLTLHVRVQVDPLACGALALTMAFTFRWTLHAGRTTILPVRSFVLTLQMDLARFPVILFPSR